MLNPTRFAVICGALVLGGVWAGAGCTITQVDSLPDRTSSNSTTTTTTTGDPTTTSGTGGTGGTGGAGGAGNGGAGGGGGSCVGVDGTGVAVTACDMMNISPQSVGGPASSICGANQNEDPPGYDYCLAGFDVYTSGSFENFQACLANIGVEPANACDQQLVFDCVAKVYNEACQRAEIDELCEGFETDCANIGQTFDIVKCSIDLAPLSNVGVQEYGDCVNDAPPEETCQQAHDLCAG